MMPYGAMTVRVEGNSGGFPVIVPIAVLGEYANVTADGKLNILSDAVRLIDMLLERERQEEAAKGKNTDA